MGQGAYKTLYLMLKASLNPAGVAVFFGEEYKNAQEAPLAMVVINPTSASFPATSFPGYAKDLDVDADTDNLWTLTETCDLTIWASADPNAETPPTAVDSAEAVEDARVAVLRAFQDQQFKGLKFVPTGGRWATFEDQMLRFGRAFVMQVSVDVTYTTTPPVYAQPPIAFDIQPDIED